MNSSSSDEPYLNEWTAMAWRRLGRLPDKASAALLEFAHGALAGNPRRVGRPLHLELEGRWSARRHPYRVIYTIDEDTRTVTIRDVGHRRDVYRSR